MLTKQAKATKIAEDNHGSRRGPTVWRIFWGLMFVGMALAVTMSMFGVVSFGMNIGWIVLLVLLLAIVVRSLASLQWFGVFMSIAGILTILTTQTAYLPLDWTPVGDGVAIGYIWAVATLLAIGFSILFRRGYKWCQHDRKAQVLDDQDGSNIMVGVNFGETVKYVSSDDFKRATLSCNFGSIKAYFDKAKIKGEKAVIEVNGSFSNIELHIPRGWDVANHVSCSLAEAKEKSRPEVTKDSPKVEIVGSMNLGELEIIYI